jgi:hypothetical protein
MGCCSRLESLHAIKSPWDSIVPARSHFALPPGSLFRLLSTFNCHRARWSLIVIPLDHAIFDRNGHGCSWSTSQPLSPQQWHFGRRARDDQPIAVLFDLVEGARGLLCRG